MEAAELRSRFLTHFAERAHTLVPSASLIANDPTLLFTIAGMVPFKPYFLGEEVAPYPRAASIQKCFRVPDIDIIGTTSRHLTFFEMLGNFSFGDYFKAEAISYAWSLVTEGFGLDPDRLWVTVHTTDDDAAGLWTELTSLGADRVQRLDEDNFWGMGATGPCGPCSEIFYDKGPAYGADGGPAFGGEERFVEFWNLVFMQYSRQADGSLEPLPKTNIDTGSGFERVLAIVNGEDSVFATDLFAPLLDTAQRAVGRSLGQDESTDIALRRIAEHGRAMTMLVGDGVLPSNEGRGYVLRRLIRRAILAARRLGATQPLTEELVTATLEKMGDAYPNLRSDRELIVEVLAREEDGFNRTLRNGLRLLEDATAEVVRHGGTVLSGDVAFTLHDTHGFPVELTAEVVAEQGLDVDRASFDLAMTSQRERARAVARQKKGAGDDAYREVLDAHGPSEFVGRSVERYVVEATVVAVLHGADGVGEVFLDATPFYAESGGQVGDTGTIATETGRLEVLDTQNVAGGLIVHRGRLTGEIAVGQLAVAAIDGERRESTRRNHTATHLLHAALRSVLGEHVRQQGSLVAPDRLRFDFAHAKSIAPDEREAVSWMVNRDVVHNDGVQTVVASRAEAESMGAIAFFGDKYGERVRVVRAGSHSLEFCGGTHVDRLGDIGQIQIVAESSIGANTRRIEAVSGLGAVERSRELEAVLQSAATLLKVAPEDVVGALDRVLEQRRDLERELGSLRQAQLSALVDRLHHQEPDGSAVVRVDGFSGDQLRQVAQELQRRGRRGVVVAGVTADGKVALAVATDGQKDAKQFASELAGKFGGGGGGNATLALAGGRDPAGLDAALEAARASLA